MRFEEAEMLGEILSEYAVRLAHEVQFSTDVDTEEYQRKLKRLLLIQHQLKEIAVAFPDVVIPAFAKNETGTYQNINTVEHLTPYNEPYITVEPIEGDEFIVRQVPAGVHVALTYEEGFLTQIVTRGTGLEGEDVTCGSFRIPGIPPRLSTLAHYKLIVQGIMGMDRGYYTSLPEPRSSVRGIVARLLRGHTTEAAGYKDIRFIAIDLFGSEINSTKYTQTQEQLIAFGFNVGVDPQTEAPYVQDGISYTLEKLKEKRQDIDSSIVIRYLQR